MCKSEIWVNMIYVYIWNMGEYDLCVYLKYGWIWFMCKSDLGVNMIYGWDLCVNMNYEWIKKKLGGTDTQLCRHTDKHINTITWPGLGAGPSENILFSLVRGDIKKSHMVTKEFRYYKTIGFENTKL